MRNSISLRAVLVISLAMAILGIAAGPAQALSYYWDTDSPIETAGFGTAGGTWGTNLYWSDSSDGTGTSVILTPTTGDDLNFGYLTTGLGAGTVAVTGTVNAQSLTFASGSGAIVLSGGTAINLAAAATITTDNAADTISSVLTGAGTSLTKAGTGVLTLSGTNTFTGQLSVQNGALAINTINNASAAGTLGNSALAVILGASGQTGTLQYTGATASSTKTFTLATGGTGAIEVTNGATNLTLSGVIGGSGAMTKTGPGVTSLSNAASTYTGVTTISAGILDATTFAAINTNSSIGKGSVAGSAADLVLNGGTLRHSAANIATTNRLFSVGTSGGTIDSSNATAANTLSFTGTGAMDFNGQTGTRTLTLTGSNTGNNTMAMLIGNDGSGNATSLTKTGSGTWILSGANTYTGATAVNAGTLKLDFSAAGALTTNIISSSSALVLGGGTLNLTGKASTTNSQAVNGTTINPGLSAITLTANATANPLSLNLGAITRNVGSALRITLPTGTPSATNGVLTTSGTGGAILLSNGVAYATIGYSNWAGMDSTNTWIAPPTYTVATPTSLSGNASLQTMGGTTTLSSNTTITSLRAAMSRNYTVNINAGLTLTTGGIMVGSGGIGSGIDDGGVFYINGPGSLMGPAGQDLVFLNHPYGITRYHPTKISAPIVDNVSATGFTYSGLVPPSGMGELLFLTGLNSYTGTTRILGGTLSIGDGGTTGSLDPNSQIVNSGSLIINRSNDLTFSNSISGTGTLTKSGAGKLLLPNNNTYSGDTYVNGGTLQIGSDNALGSGAILYLSGGAIEASGASRTITALVDLTASSSVVGSQDVTFSNTFFQDYVNNTPGGVVLTNNLDAGKMLTINGEVPIKRQNSNSTVGFGGTGDTVINGIISQGNAENPSVLASLFKSGTGTLTFSGASANTYNGLTTVSAGTLALAKLNGATATQAIAGGGLTIGGADNTAATVQYAASTTNPDMMGTGVVTLNGRGILDFNGATDTIGAVAIVSTGATTTNPTPIINTAGGGNLTIGTLGITPVAGFTSVVNAGTGTITLGGDVTFTAATTGQAQISGTALALGAANRNFTVGLGTGATQDLLVDAQITGARSLTKLGAGRLTLANTNAYTLGTTVSAGSLLLSGAFDMPTTGTVAVSAGGAFSLADGTARATNGATAGVGLTLATGSWLGFDWNGGSLDSFTTAGTATATGAVAININNTSPTDSGGTLITAAVGSTLNGATYLLANNTNYTATISSTATTVSIGAQTPATALTDAYWKGDQVAGAPGTMTVSTGTTSNWASDATGTPVVAVIPGGSAVNVIFGATGAAQQANVTAGLSDMNLGSITFNDSAAVTIAGASSIITLNSTSGTAATTSGALAPVTAGSAISVTSFANATNTISANLALGANQTWNVPSGKTLVVSGFVTGAGSLTLADAGTVTLSGANSYSGGTNLNGGTLNLGSAGALGSTGTISFGGGTLRHSASNTTDYSGRFSTAASQAYNIDTNGQSVTWATALTSSGGTLTKSGAGTLTLSGTNSYSGGTIINAGQVNISNVNNLGGPGRNVTFTGTATLMPSNASYTGANALGTLTIGSGATANIIPSTGNSMTFATLTGAGTLHWGRGNGASTFTITDASAFTGELRVSPGSSSAPTISVGGLTDTGTPGVGNLQYGVGTIQHYSTIEFSTLPGPLTLFNRRVEILAGSNVLTAFLNNNAANNVIIKQDLVNASSGAKPFQLGGSNTGANEFAGVISNGTGGGTISFINAGTWILSGANTYTGKTTISAGTLSINSIQDAGSATANALGTPAMGADSIINLASTGTLRYIGTGHSSNRVINLTTAAGGTFTLNASGPSGTFALTGGVTNAGTSGTSTVALTGTGLGSQSGAIANGTGTNVAAVTKSGAGTWTLSGTNTYTGATTISAGGKLYVNGTHNPSASAATTYSVLGTLGGNGTINTTADPVTVGNGGKLAPGTVDAPGTLTMNLGAAALSLDAAKANNLGEFTFRIGAVSDKIVLGAGTFLALGAGSATNSSLDWTDFTFIPGTGLANGVYTLIEAGTNATGELSTGVGLLTGAIGIGTGTLSISGGQDLILSVTGLVLPGDTNGDRVVDAADYIAVKQNLGLTGGASLGQGNLDGDGDVDWDDLQIVMTNFGAGSGTTPATTPEPATLGLLMVGALAVIRRRRK
jgi:autotransporter-associated beta strand protein